MAMVKENSWYEWVKSLSFKVVVLRPKIVKPSSSTYIRLGPFSAVAVGLMKRIRM